MTLYVFNTGKNVDRKRSNSDVTFLYGMRSVFQNQNQLIKFIDLYRYVI